MGRLDLGRNRGQTLVSYYNMRAFSYPLTYFLNAMLSSNLAVLMDGKTWAKY
jgi:hypothetical protein